MRRTLPIFLLLFGVVVWWWLHRSLTPQIISPETSETNEPVVSPKAGEFQRQSSPTKTANTMTRKELAELREQMDKRQKEIEERSLDEWRAPINFYGKVVDENDQPVEGAHVAFGWNDLSPTEGHSTAQTTSDFNGQFSLENKTGKLLSVAVTKEGYYASKSAKQYFEYGDRYEHFIPHSNLPVIFHLRKHGNAEPLIVFENDFLISKDGKAVDISLIKGKPVPLGQGDLRVECWTDDQGKKRGEKYDWKCRVTVPNGGLAFQTTNEFNFEAPLEGYQSFDEINMPTTLENGWQRSAERNYFLKLGNGNYARIKFKMIAGGGHFFYIESFLNPAGSRNLEYDPAVQTKQTVFE